MNNNQTENKFFDLHTTGVGYLNRFRIVTPTNGNPYQSVTIAALRGNVNNVSFTYFDCIIVEDEAKNVLLNLVDTDEKDAKYMVGFNIGDIYPETFTYKTGNKQGQTGISLKGRLIKIKWLKKNNELIYKPQEKSAEEQSQAHQAPLEEQAVQQAPINQAPVQSMMQNAPTLEQSTTVQEQSVIYQNQNQVQPQAQQQTVKVSEVFLSKEDPDFASKKETLKQQGYRWNGERQSWQPPVAA